MNPQLSNLIDIGANLTHSAFEHDFEKVITESKSAGLSHIILTGTDLHSSTAATNLARQRPNFFSSTAGFHPHVSGDVTTADFDHLQTLLTNPEVVAIGETGLDFNRNYSPPDKQRQASEKIAGLKVLFEAELEQLKAHRGAGALVTQQDVMQILPRILAAAQAGGRSAA